jgi:hypothetical protein
VEKNFKWQIAKGKWQMEKRKERRDEAHLNFAICDLPFEIVLSYSLFLQLIPHPARAG